MKINITEKTVKAIRPPDSGSVIYYDSAVRGFGVRTTANGSVSFILNYSLGGRERRYTIDIAERAPLLNALMSGKTPGEDTVQRHANQEGCTFDRQIVCEAHVHGVEEPRMQVAHDQSDIDAHEERPVSVGASVRMTGHRMRQLVQQTP